MTPQEARKASDARNVILKEVKERKNAKRFGRDDNDSNDVMRSFDYGLEAAIKNGKYEFSIYTMEYDEYDCEEGKFPILGNCSQFIRLICKKIEDRGFGWEFTYDKTNQHFDITVTF